VIEQRSPAAYIAEFIGTFILVLAITLSVSLFVNSSGTGSDWVVVGLVHFLTLFLLVQTLGSVSGAHLNPAVTVSLAVLRKIRINDAVVYILLQLAGAVAAALVLKLLLIDDLADQQHYGAPSLNHSLLGTTAGGLIAEGIGTFILMFAILGIVDGRSPNELAGIIIGGIVVGIIMVVGPITGASLNPARAFTPELVSAIGGGATHWSQLIPVYVLPGLVGSGLAALAYDLIANPRVVPRPIKTAVTTPETQSGPAAVAK
jgi:glycerol uptake facilitator protein